MTARAAALHRGHRPRRSAGWSGPPLLLALAAVLATSNARAGRAGWDTYPQAIIDRPLTLPNWVAQLSAEGSLTHASAQLVGGGRASGIGASASLGLDLGVAARTQVGVFLTVPVSPFVGFGQLVFDVQHALVPGVASLRLDIGLQHQVHHYQVMDSPVTDDHDAFLLGVGLPLVVRLHPMVALVSGSTSARGFDSPPILNRAGSLHFGASLATQDLLTVGAWALPTGGVLAGVIHLPVGVLFQPHPVFALRARVGYRFAFLLDSGGSSVGHFLPLALDVLVSLGRVLDLGLTGSLTGSVAGDTAQGFADARKIDLWLQGRF